MKKIKVIFILVVGCLLFNGCSVGKFKVTTFHNNLTRDSVAAKTIKVLPYDNSLETSLEFQSYRNLVDAELRRRGFIVFKKGETVKGLLGVRPKQLTPEGFLIGEVRPNSPAAKADIRVGDIITEFNKQELKGLTEADLRAAFKDNKTIIVIPPDTDVDVVVIRGGKPLTLKVHTGIRKIEDLDYVALVGYSLEKKTTTRQEPVMVMQPAEYVWDMPIHGINIQTGALEVQRPAGERMVSSGGLKQVGTKTIKENYFLKNLALDIAEAKSYEGSGVIKIYEGRVESSGSCGRRTTVVPSMIRALFKNFPGKSGATQKIVFRGGGRC